MAMESEGGREGREEEMEKRKKAHFSISASFHHYDLFGFQIC